MLENQKIHPALVIGPLGERLTLDKLPSSDTTRWTVRRKAEVVAAVAGGLMTFDEACDRYALTIEEFTSWQRAVNRSGVNDLVGDGGKAVWPLRVECARLARCDHLQFQSTTISRFAAVCFGSKANINVAGERTSAYGCRNCVTKPT